MSKSKLSRNDKIKMTIMYTLSPYIDMEMTTESDSEGVINVGHEVPLHSHDEGKIKILRIVGSYPTVGTTSNEERRYVADPKFSTAEVTLFFIRDDSDDSDPVYLFNDISYISDTRYSSAGFNSSLADLYYTLVTESVTYDEFITLLKVSSDYKYTIMLSNEVDDLIRSIAEEEEGTPRTTNDYN